MCGIVTYCSLKKAVTTNTNHKKFFKQALIADTFRGKDSTGIFAVPHQITEPVDIFKRALTAYDFIETNQYNRFELGFKDYKFIVGHNRASTKGASSDANAHPFQYGDITLVHNGTITGHNSLIKGKEVFTVDSEAICYAFDERSPEEVIPEISGAFALIWHDAKDESINFVRNSERPFYLAKIKGEEAIIGASEVKMLEWIADRNNITHEEPFELKEGMMMKFTDSFTKPAEVKKLKLKPVRVAAASGYRGWYDDGKYTGYQGGHNNYARESSKTVATNAFKKRVNFTEGDTVHFTVDRIVRYQTTGTINCKLFGTFTSSLGVEYPVRDYTFPLDQITGLKKGTKMAGTISSFFKNTENNHHNIQTHFMSIRGAVPSNTLLERIKSKSPFVPTNKEVIVVGGEGVYGPRGIKITQLKFDKLTDKGCAVCQGNVSSKDHNATLWTSDDQPICKTCATTDVGREHADTHYAVL